MNEIGIRDAVRTIIDNIPRSESTRVPDEALGSLIENFLVNQQRIADSLEKLAGASADALDPCAPNTVIYTRQLD